MGAADIARFVVVIGLGVLAFITFLVAGTIVGLMVVDGDRCRECLSFPVGLAILGLLAVFFLISMVQEWRYAPPAFKEWFAKNRTNVIIGLIIVAVFTFIFVWSKEQRRAERREARDAERHHTRRSDHFEPPLHERCFPPHHALSIFCADEKRRP